MNFLVFEAKTGVILRQGTAPDIATVQMQAFEGECAVAVEMLPGVGRWKVDRWRVRSAGRIHRSDDILIEIDTSKEDAAAAVSAFRHERNARLSASDWTQLPDAPVDQVAWAAYRSALRELPETTDPLNPVWPTPPA